MTQEPGGQEGPRRPQEDPGGPRMTLEDPGGGPYGEARRSYEDPGGAREAQVSSGKPVICNSLWDPKVP